MPLGSTSAKAVRKTLMKLMAVIANHNSVNSRTMGSVVLKILRTPVFENLKGVNPVFQH